MAHQRVEEKGQDDAEAEGNNLPGCSKQDPLLESGRRQHICSFGNTVAATAASTAARAT